MLWILMLVLKIAFDWLTWKETAHVHLKLQTGQRAVDKNALTVFFRIIYLYQYAVSSPNNHFPLAHIWSVFQWLKFIIFMGVCAWYAWCA